MKNIPPEIDRLLWAVAEDVSPRAADEFVERYPRYAGELARRRQMVQGLKGGRPTPAQAPRPRPTFRPAARPAPAPRRMLVAVGALVLAAVAVGAYTVAKLAEPASTSPSAVAHGNPSPRPEPTTPDTTQRLPETAPPKPDPGPAPESSSDAKPGPETNQAGSAEKPQSFKVKGADLTAALTMLGAEAGVQIVVAPGMGKRKVDADYENVPLSEILSDLGRRYGFTPFDQGDGTIIVVPARDSATASGSDAEIVRHQREDERIGQ